MRLASRIALFIAVVVTASSHVRANCQLGGTACGDPAAVACNAGVVCFPPYRTCTNCICTTTNAGQTCLPASSEPGVVAVLQIDRAGTPGDLALSWGASCAGAGRDYAMFEGILGSWYSHEPIRCSSGGAIALTVTPAVGDRYYVIAPTAAGFTGSLGASSAGVERPDGSPSCTNDRALAPCP